MTSYVDESAGNIPEALAVMCHQSRRGAPVQGAGAPAWPPTASGATRPGRPPSPHWIPSRTAACRRAAEALAAYDHALALDAGYASAYASRGVARFRLGRPEEALADLDRALELDPFHTWARTQRDAVRRAVSPGAAGT
ncbi:hypothetical protein SGRIM128S_01805 [Streptomyces griseomycini]